MRVVIGMATIKGRELQLQRTLDSLEGQADEIIVWNNDLKNNDYSI